MTDKTRESFKGKTIGVLLGGMSSERDVSRKTGAAILHALHKRNYQAVAIEADRDVANKLRRNSIDVAFIALHGSFGEDGTIQGLLELMGVPYTGSSVLASAVAINKVLAKKIFSYHGLPTPAFQAFRAEDGTLKEILDRITIPLPYVIKPSEEGSTIGISIIDKQENSAEGLKTAFCCSNEILVEEYIDGREITAGILNARALPLVEIQPKSGFYDYSAKYTKGATAYIVPAELDVAITDTIQNTAAAAYAALGCSGVARVDFVLSGRGTPFILELNSVPGMTETSLLPMAAKQAGIDFESLIEEILWSAALHKCSPAEGGIKKT